MKPDPSGRHPWRRTFGQTRAFGQSRAYRRLAGERGRPGAAIRMAGAVVALVLALGLVWVALQLLTGPAAAQTTPTPATVLHG